CVSLDTPHKDARRTHALELPLAAVADCDNAAGVGQVDTHDRAAVFGMRPEIMKRVGVAAGNDLACACRQLGHGCTTSRSSRMRQAPSSGMCVQVGRLVSSYSIS